jgi:hypothetical protein
MRVRRTILGVATLVVAAVVLVWFQPQKLLIDETVDEAAPTPAAVDAADADAGTTTPPRSADAGDFVSLDHGTTGRVQVVDVGTNERIVRIEDLRTDNGPDLYVYLSTNTVDGDEGAFDDDVVNLGRLKGNEGNQNYGVPAGTDLSRFRSVVIWCDRFNSAFGAAPLAVV